MFVFHGVITTTTLLDLLQGLIFRSRLDLSCCWNEGFFFPGLFNSMYHMLIVCEDLEEFWRFCAYGDLRHIFPIKLSHIPHTLIIFPKREMAPGRNALRNRWRAKKRKRRRQRGGILPLAAFIPALIVGGKAIDLAAAGTGASFAVNKALESASRRRWFSWFIKKIILPLPNFMIRTTDHLDLSNFHASSVSSSAKQHCL